MRKAKSDTVYINRNGLFGKLIEYETNLSLKEVEDRLHKTHEGISREYGKTFTQNKFRYVHPSRLICEISIHNVSYRNRNWIFKTALAEGTITRETDSDLTKIVFRTSIAQDVWTWLLLILILGIGFAIVFATLNINPIVIALIIAAICILLFLELLLRAIGDMKKLLAIVTEIF